MHILDTNTLIYFFKGMGNVAERLLNTLPKDIGIPAVVLYELEYGIARSTSPKKKNKTAWRHLLFGGGVIIWKRRGKSIRYGTSIFRTERYINWSI